MHWHLVVRDEDAAGAESIERSHQARQRRYREKLARQRKPEASAVDLALSGSAVAYIDAIEAKLGTAADRKVPKILLRGALDLLAAAGYDRAESTAVLRRRVTRDGRKDIQGLVETSRVESRLRACR
jgi:hypothetical protein